MIVRFRRYKCEVSRIGKNFDCELFGSMWDRFDGYHVIKTPRQVAYAFFRPITAPIVDPLVLRCPASLNLNWCIELSIIHALL